MEPGTCEVWWASTAWLRPWHADVLSDGERARRAGLWDPGHRAQYTVAAALLRLVAAPLTERTAAGVVADRSCPSCGRHHGRPHLPGTGLDVSISHSGATVAVAVSNAGPVGVDVQQVADDAVGELSPLVLAESEAGHVAGARDFFTYWTRKEALVKATGDGSRCRWGRWSSPHPGRRPACSAIRDQAGWPRSSATSTPTSATSAPSPCSALGPSSSRSGPGSGC
jgi:4'-phosphopantetheinyl transferase